MASANPQDYVFYPEHKNRDYALDSMGRLFRTILDKNNLRRSAKAGSERYISLQAYSAYV